MKNWFETCLLTRPSIRRRIWAAALVVCMMVTMMPMQTYAVKTVRTVETMETAGLCEHHTEHTLECGYTEGTAGTPCSHEHTEDCYMTVKDCIHKHAEDCYAAGAEIATDSEAKDPVNCEHVCSDDTGCITQEPDCTHERGKHDDTCGYTEKTEGASCTYLCEICNPAEKDAELQHMKANTLKAMTSGNGWEIIEQDMSYSLTISTQDGMTNWVNDGLAVYKGDVGTVTIEASVTEIPERAFYDCTSLTTVTAPGVTSIGQYAFANCALKDASFPEVETIGIGAFAYCTWLKDASFPKVKTISSSMFSGCEDLSSASFPTVEKIESNAFVNCSKLAELKLPAKPPIVVNADAFENCFHTRALTFVNGDNPLEGEALTTAQVNYKGFDDGDTANNFWYGWIIGEPAADKGWKIDADGNLTISTAAGMTDWATKVNANKDKVKTVTIAEAVTGIPNNAFKECTNLENVTADGAITIGDSAFHGCSKLSGASFPAATRIGFSAFWSCTELASTNFPVVKTIGTSAFSDCTKLGTLKLPAAPPTANATAFKKCPINRTLDLVDANSAPLTDAALATAQAAYKAVPGSDSNTTDNLWYGWTIGEPAADKGWTIDASDNLTISTDDGMTDWATNGLATNKIRVKTVTIVEAVTVIADKAFWGCTNLESVTADGAITIGSYAFYNCEALTSADFPEATTINAQAFDSCEALTSVSFPAATIIGKGAFYECTALTRAYFPEATTIEYAAFISCVELTSAIFPAAETIGEGAFAACKALPSASFPAATTIDNGAFVGCEALKSADFPAATTIDNGAFADCTALATLSLPAAPPNVTGTEVFLNCPPVRALAFVNSDGIALTGDALATAQANYKQDMGDGDATDKLWYGWETDVVPVDEGWTIDASGNLTISTAAGMTNWVEKGLDTNRTTVTTVTIDKTVTVIADVAFPGCTNLESVTADGAITIGESAFQECSKMTSASFPAAKTIDQFAFYKCTALKSVSFPVAKTIEKSAFHDCTVLTSVNVPAATNIGESAFDNCTALKSADFPVAETIDWYAFFNCTALTSVSFPVATSIGDAAFYGCTALATLSLPAEPPSVTDADVFLDCPSVRALRFVNPDGSILTGNALATAQANYKQDAGDGNATDTLWYGWKTDVVPTVDKSALITAIANAKSIMANTVISVQGGADVSTSTYWVLPDIMSAAKSALSEAEAIVAKADGTQAEVDNATVKLNAKVNIDFKNAKKAGRKSSGIGGGSGNGGGSSSGGSGGSSSSTTQAPSQPAVKIPGTGQATIPTTVDQNGNANVSVTDKNITDAIADAKKDVPQGQPITVEIKVNTDKDASQLITTLPQSVRDTLINNQVGSLTIGNKDVSMTFSQAAISQMNAQAQGNLIITAMKADTAKLIGNAQTLIGNRPTYDFKAICDGKSITDLGANAVTITIPYILKEGETAANMQAIRVDANGVATVVPGSVYDVTKQAVVFATGNVTATYGISYSQVAVPATSSEVIHTVQKGEILAEIAKRYRTTIQDIANLNNIQNPDQLEIGQTIRIPQ